ncbi:MAG TPA: hypothetical protein VJH04_01325 [archaeon]|nr:hypothetical protein [archaeon]
MSLLDLKKMVINELMNQIEDKKELGKEFNLTEGQINALIEKMLDKWLNNTDFVVMIATALGLSMPRKTKDRSSRYIG